ncbi:hypothetical protein Tco_0369853 [Tanacetum coccineum]
MDNSKRGHIPMQERLDLNKSQGAQTPKELNRMKNVPYDSVVGSIMYAVRCTRLDVAFEQNITSRFQQNPGKLHWTAVKNILKCHINICNMPKSLADEIILSYNDCMLRQPDLAILNGPNYLQQFAGFYMFVSPTFFAHIRLLLTWGLAVHAGSLETTSTRQSLQILVHWSNMDLLGRGYEKKCFPKMLGSPLTDTVRRKSSSYIRFTGGSTTEGKYKEAAGWTVADLKGIGLSLCMHRIVTEPQIKPS